MYPKIKLSCFTNVGKEEWITDVTDFSCTANCMVTLAIHSHKLSLEQKKFSGVKDLCLNIIMKQIKK